MKDNATLASSEHDADDASISRPTQAASWDPFEVWLTRVKQPRDSAAKSAPAKRSKAIRHRHD